MAFNDDMFHGKWTEIKGEIQKKWGHLTDNDLEATKGNATSLLGLIQQKVGMAKEEGSQYLHELAQRFNKSGLKTEKDLSNKANSSIDRAKSNLK